MLTFALTYSHSTMLILIVAHFCSYMSPLSNAYTCRRSLLFILNVAHFCSYMSPLTNAYTYCRSQILILTIAHLCSYLWSLLLLLQFAYDFRSSLLHIQLVVYFYYFLPAAHECFNIYRSILLMLLVHLLCLN